MNGDWRAAVPTAEWEIYDAAGFGRESGLGEHPAVLVIDVQYRTIGDEPLPIRESMERWYKTSCGEAGWRAVAGIERLLDAAREGGVPVIYPYVAPKTEIDRGRSGTKIPGLMTVPSRGYEFPEQTAPQEGDLLLPKRHPSAFFGTPLTSYLVDMGIDGLIITGCTTSGCVRATAVDAFSYNFHAVVVEDCVYDRSETSHKVNLFDLQSKYADVLPLERVLELLPQPARA